MNSYQKGFIKRAQECGIRHDRAIKLATMLGLPSERKVSLNPQPMAPQPMPMPAPITKIPVPPMPVSQPMR